MPNRVQTFISSRSRREQLILAVVAVFLVIVAAYVFLLKGSSDVSVTDTGPPVRPPTSTGPPTPKTTTPPISNRGFEGKDPFQPLVVVDSGGGAPPPGSSGGPSGPNQSGQTTRVTLTDIFTEDGTRMASVQVDDQNYTVEEGDTFASNFEVIDITARCATFLFGDERFTLCIGQEVRK